MDNNFNENVEKNEQAAFDSGINYGPADSTSSAQQIYQQPVYQQPTYAQQMGMQNNEPVSIGDWLVVMLISLIPCVNIVMLFVWAFGEGKESKKNWAKAQLIFIAIVIGLNILLGILFGTAVLSILRAVLY